MGLTEILLARKDEHDDSTFEFLGLIRKSSSDILENITDFDLENVFTEFKALSARSTGNETSTGLGLSIVKQLVEQIGGGISVRSEGKNKGSAFEVTLIIEKP